MTAKPEFGAPATATDYYYRRRLTLREQLPAMGVALGAAAAAFYVVRILLQRTPLVPVRDIPTLGPISPQGRSSSFRTAPRKRGELESSPTITRRSARRVDAG
jgi:hypothetical protein